MQDGGQTGCSVVPLCFLFTKFGKLDIKIIKTALVDFYPSEEITAAKERLVKDAQALSLDGMPTIARRRNSDNRYQRECDEMIDIITFLDERKSILPRYAFDYSDHFPSAHLDEGNMRLLLRKLDNMQEELMATRKLVQKAKQGKSRFDQMLDKVHPQLKMTLEPLALSAVTDYPWGRWGICSRPWRAWIAPPAPEKCPRPRRAWIAPGPGGLGL